MPAPRSQDRPNMPPPYQSCVNARERAVLPRMINSGGTSDSDEARREVPGEISVVGFDDIPEAAFFQPPLTTVRQDFIEMGRRSLRLLLRTIESGRRSDEGSLVPPELIVRRSTAPPGSS